MRTSINLLVAAAAFLASTTEAKWNSCGASDYMIGVKAFNQGFQNDITSMTTDCF